jgi:hypothetical protein
VLNIPKNWLTRSPTLACEHLNTWCTIVFILMHFTLNHGKYFAGAEFCPMESVMQVVMPTVESDVAFGLGKTNLSLDEVRSRVSKSLEAVGMLSYSQVGS